VIVAKDTATFYPTDDNMVNGAGGIDSGFARHANSLAYEHMSINLYNNGRYILK
jgi:hypothetical protein